MKTQTIQGFSLLELLIALTIIGILTMIAFPSVEGFSQKLQSRAFKVTLLRNLNLARTHSVNHGKNTIICGINDDKHCINNSFTALAVFQDVDRDRIISSNDPVIRVEKLNYTGILSLKAGFGRTYLEFNRQGSAVTFGTFIYCHPNKPEFSQRVTVNRVGRSYAAIDYDGDGIITLASGDSITC